MSRRTPGGVSLRKLARFGHMAVFFRAFNGTVADAAVVGLTSLRPRQFRCRKCGLFLEGYFMLGARTARPHAALSALLF